MTIKEVLVYLDVEHWGANNLGLLDNMPAPAVQHTIDASNSILGALKHTSNSTVTTQSTSLVLTLNVLLLLCEKHILYS